MDTDKKTEGLVERAVAGDRQALEELVAGVEDMVYNLSLRMLGTVGDVLRDLRANRGLSMLCDIRKFPAVVYVRLRRQRQRPSGLWGNMPAGGRKRASYNG